MIVVVAVLADPGPKIVTTIVPQPEPRRRRWFQFSVRSLLVIMAGTSVFFGLLRAGWYGTAFCCLATSGIFLMAVDIVLGRASRGWAAGLLLAGICYAVGNIGVFLVTMSFDAFAIFHVGYIIPAGFGGPGLMIIASITVAEIYKKLHWIGVLGFAIWIGCVGFAHLWIIAQCSASV
jgi:hypothetical protein